MPPYWVWMWFFNAILMLTFAKATMKYILESKLNIFLDFVDFDGILLVAFSKVVFRYSVGIRSKFVTPLTLYSCHTAGKTQPMECLQT